MTAPREQRPPRPPHVWTKETPRVARWYHLTRAVLGESELVEGRGLITGYTRSCDRCGIVQVFAALRDDSGDPDDGPRWREVTFTGFDLDSLTPLRTPPCEVLARPWVTAEDLGDPGPVDVQQLALDFGRDAGGRAA